MARIGATRTRRAGMTALLAATLALGALTGTALPAYADVQDRAPGEATSSALYPAGAEDAAYDPRTTEGTSAVRDQFWGTCWAQAGISTTESALIHGGLEGTDVQLSVEDLLWWTHESGWNLFRREDSGFPPMATGYLTTVGVRSEADIPYLGRPADFADDDIKDMHPSNAYGEGENLRPANYGAHAGAAAHAGARAHARATAHADARAHTGHQA